MSELCRLCNILKNKEGKYKDIDKPFFIGARYYSLVSIGAFVEGWTLIVSREHKYNLRHDYSNKEFYEYLQKHIRVLRNKLGWKNKIIVFEHGANKCDSQTACGTSHAHLHVLPFSGSILTEIKKEKKWITCRWSEVNQVVSDKEYLLYCEEPERGMNAKVYINIVIVPESQYFRRVIFNKLNLKGSYRYKDDPRIEESTNTKRVLGG